MSTTPARTTHARSRTGAWVRRVPSIRALFHGAWAALLAPLWLDGRRLKTMLAPPPPGIARPEVDPITRLRAADSARVARSVLARLARLPGSPWRNTCLFRAIATYIVLSRFHLPARLRIGVRRDSGAGGPSIVAHAWIECVDPALEVGRQPGLEPLESASAANALVRDAEFA